MSKQTFTSQDDSRGCAVVTRSHHVPKIGNAPSSEIRGMVFVEFPLPWTPKVEETPGFPQELLAMTKQHGYKTHAITSLESSLTQEDVMHADFPFRILIYQRPRGPLNRYKLLELQVPRKVIKKVIGDVLSGSLESSMQYLADAPNKGVKDVFICIHGSRDACCGEFGIQLLSDIKSLVPKDAVRLWGVSHVGKHIFAPNVMIFPDGQLWGHVTTSILKNIITRSRPIQEALPFYRGTIGFDTPVQVLEQEILKKEGWKWFNYHRQGWFSEENPKNSRFKVMIDYFDDEMKRIGSYEGHVEIIKTERVLTSKCNPKIRYKMCKVIDLNQSSFNLNEQRKNHVE